MAKTFIDLDQVPHAVTATLTGGAYRMGGKLGDDAAHDIYFHRTGTLVDPPTATYQLELKEPSEYEADPLVRVVTFTEKTDSESQKYLEISPEWHSAAVLAILEPGGDRQPRKLYAMAEITWQDGDTVIASTESFEAVIHNDINKAFTGAAVPTPATPWPSSNVDTYDGPAISGFAGGSLNDVIEHLASPQDKRWLLDFEDTQHFSDNETLENDVTLPVRGPGAVRVANSTVNWLGTKLSAAASDSSFNLSSDKFDYTGDITTSRSLRVGDDITVTNFANAANNGSFRVDTVAATKITVTELNGDPVALVDEVGASDTRVVLGFDSSPKPYVTTGKITVGGDVTLTVELDGADTVTCSHGLFAGGIYTKGQRVTFANFTNAENNGGFIIDEVISNKVIKLVELTGISPAMVSEVAPAGAYITPTDDSKTYALDRMLVCGDRTTYYVSGQAPTSGGKFSFGVEMEYDPSIYADEPVTYPMQINMSVKSTELINSSGAIQPDGSMHINITDRGVSQPTFYGGGDPELTCINRTRKNESVYPWIPEQPYATIAPRKRFSLLIEIEGDYMTVTLAGVGSIKFYHEDISDVVSDTTYFWFETFGDSRLFRTAQKVYKIWAQDEHLNAEAINSVTQTLHTNDEIRLAGALELQSSNSPSPNFNRAKNSPTDSAYENARIYAKADSKTQVGAGVGENNIGGHFFADGQYKAEVGGCGINQQVTGRAVMATVQDMTDLKSATTGSEVSLKQIKRLNLYAKAEDREIYTMYGHCTGGATQQIILRQTVYAAYADVFNSAALLDGFTGNFRIVVTARCTADGYSDMFFTHLHYGTSVSEINRVELAVPQITKLDVRINQSDANSIVFDDCDHTIKRVSSIT